MRIITKNNEECLICGAPIQYAEFQVFMTCELCKRSFMSNSRCKNGHYICDNCHSKKGIEILVNKCKNYDTCDPLEIEETLYQDQAVHMHGPEHHSITGAAILTAFYNAGGQIDLDRALKEVVARGKQVPGGTCGFWGCCGAAASCGIAYSIIEKITPLSEEAWGDVSLLTSRLLAELARYGGPRCCKRTSYLSTIETVRFIADKLGVQMTLPEKHTCIFHDRNKECLRKKCPFYPGR